MEISHYLPDQGTKATSVTALSLRVGEVQSEGQWSPLQALGAVRKVAEKGAPWTTLEECVRADRDLFSASESGWPETAPMAS